jgi:hypothetical protein
VSPGCNSSVSNVRENILRSDQLTYPAGHLRHSRDLRVPIERLILDSSFGADIKLSS